MHSHRISVLGNGLTLIQVPMKGVESTTLILGAGVGSRYEPDEKRGISHFLEHMAFKGTKKRPKPTIISSEVDGVGGEFNAFTGVEFTGFYIKSRSKHLKLSFDILSDMLKNSLFSQKEIEKEKKVIVEEIRMYEDIPMRKVEENFNKLIFGETPLGKSIAGEEETVKSIKREDFFSWLDKFYYPSNLVLTVAGKINNFDIESYAKEYFDIEKRNRVKTYVSQKISQTKPKLDVCFKQTEQAHFVLGVPGFSYFSPRRYPALILAAYLGGGMSSRLFSQLRGKHGLGYYVYCTSDTFSDTGCLAAQAGVDVRRINLALKLVLQEFYKTAQKKISPKELEKTKEMIKGRFLLELESTSKVARSYCQRFSLERKVKSLQEIIKAIDEVSSTDVYDTAREIFKKQRLNLAVVGPYKQDQALKKLLEEF